MFIETETVADLFDDLIGKVMNIDKDVGDPIFLKEKKVVVDQGRGPTGSSGFGRSLVRGRSRVPYPAAKIIAFITVATPLRIRPEGHAAGRGAGVSQDSALPSGASAGHTGENAGSASPGRCKRTGRPLLSFAGC